MEASASTSVPVLAPGSSSSAPLSSSSATEANKWFRQYTLLLSDAVTQWKDRSSSERLTIVKRLQLVLAQRMFPSSSTVASSTASNSCLLTLHTFSHLLSRDSASDPSFTRWTRHPKFSEQLLIALLQLFQLCLSLSGTVRVLENSHHFSFAFLIAQLNSLAADESALPIRRHALLTVVALAHAIQPSLLAAFLPGIVSSTLSILTKSPRLHSTLAITGLNLLTVIIRRAINPSKKQPLSMSEKLESLSLSSSSPAPAPSPSSSKIENKIKNTTKSTSSASRTRPRLPNSLNYNSGASPSNKLSRDSSLHIDIQNEEWISKTTSNFLPRLKPIVLSRQGPRFHSLASVRAAYVRFLNFVIEQDHLILDDVHQSFFKMALFECCIHSYMTVSQLGVDVLRKFFKRHGRMHFERAIVACIRFANHQQTDAPTRSPIDIDVDSLKQLASTATYLDHYFHHRISVNDNKDEFSLVIFSACLAVLIPQQPSNTRESNDNEELYVIPLARLQAFMYRVGVMSFVDMLLALHQRLWNPSRVDRLATEEALNNHVIQFANRLGSVGLLGCVYDPLTALASTGSMNQIQSDNRDPPSSSTETETGIAVASSSVTSHLARDDGPDMDMDMNSFKICAHSSLILQAVLESALKNALHNGSEKQGGYIKRCAKEVIELMSQLFVPNSQHHHVDDTMITLKLSLTSQLESLVTLLSRSSIQNPPSSRQRQKRIGSDFILVFLMHLLRDATHGDPIIKPVAIDALTHIAKCDGLDSYRMLLLKHINFIVSRVIWHLHQPWAVNVLKFVVGPTPDDVGTETSLLLNKTLKSICDTMSAVSDERAIQMLASIKAVLSIAVIQKNSSPQIDQTVNEEEDANNSVDKDLLEVHRTLFQYCTEDDWDEDDNKLMELSKVIDSDRFVPGNDLFDGFGEDNNESDVNDEDVEPNKEEMQPDLNVSSFEDIAQYALTGTQDLLVGRSWTVRAAALECITLGVRYLKRRKKLLFPHVAKLLPLFPSQLDCIGSRQESLLTSGERMFNAMKQRRNTKHISDTIYELNDKAAHLPVVTNLCQSIASLAECAGVFIRDRFIRLIYPKLVPLLDVITYFPTLIVVSPSDTQVDIIPSHGTMSAGDAVLEAFASIAQFTPATLAPYTGAVIRAVAPLLDADKFHPEIIAQAYPSRFQNQNLLRAEVERWDHRVECVSRTIRGLVIANESETFCSLLCIDPHVPHVLKSGHDELVDIYVSR